MSKKNENNQQGTNPADQIPENNQPENNSAGSEPDKGKGDNIRTIEEHKENMGISAPVFAAVMQTQKWGSGKKVPEAVFKNAVEEFLGAPMDGAKKDVPAIEAKEEKPDEGSGGGE